MDERRARVWVGVDVGKSHHWACVIDETGTVLWSQRIANDEAAIQQALGEILPLAERTCWAVDLVGNASALLLALLTTYGQQALYVPGRTVNRMAGAYRGEAKTDARDAYVIAETARHRRDLAAAAMPTQTLVDLALLSAYRDDLVADRTRLLNRLRDALTGIFPALERAFDFADHRGALVLLTGYQTPGALRRAGHEHLTAWLAEREVRRPASVAERALTCAAAQRTELAGQQVAAGIVADLAEQLLALDQRISGVESQMAAAFRTHPQATIIESMPGIGPVLGPLLLAAAGDLTAYRDAGHLACAAGLVPVPRDSGRRTGNLHRPTRYNRRLRRVFYLSALSSIVRPGPNREFYLRKRAEGFKHVQAVIALARRRVSVLWALLRDNRTFTITAPHPHPTA